MLTSIHAAIQSRFQSEDFDLHAPTHFHVELLSALRGHTLSRGSLPDDGKIVRGILLFPVRTHTIDPLIPRIWELRHNITSYDAAYVALAEAINAPLLTRDQKLAKSKGHRARIEVL